MEQPATKGRKPSHRLFSVVGNGEFSQWIEIGAAWPTKSGGFTQTLNAVPLQGRIVMLPVEEQETGGQQ